MTEIIKFYRSTGVYGFLSNLYRSAIQFEGCEFKSSEHAYQYGKTEDWETKSYIRSAPTPVLACIVGHGLFPFMVVKNWKELRVPRMKAVLLAKFKQHEDLKEKLLATGDAEIIEASKSDGFWGVGKGGHGKNMLGKLLMELRAHLRAEAAQPPPSFHKGNDR